MFRLDPVSLCLLAALALSGTTAAQTDPELVERWSQPFEPFHIVDNLHYVGAHEVTAFLITTSEGHILLDGGLPETGPMIEQNIRTLGFDPKDVRYLINSHAHFDHAGGLAWLKQATGAQLVAMRPDAPWLESGQAGFGAFPAVRVDRIIDDGDQVSLGGTVLVAHLTAGHTPGCTTWTMTVDDDGRRYDVVFVGSPSALPEHRLVDNPHHPEILEDFEATFRTLESLPVDLFFASHGSFFQLRRKAPRLAEEGVEVFIDPQGYQRFIERKHVQFQAELARQRANLP